MKRRINSNEPLRRSERLKAKYGSYKVNTPNVSVSSNNDINNDINSNELVYKRPESCHGPIRHNKRIKIRYEPYKVNTPNVSCNGDVNNDIIDEDPSATPQTKPLVTSEEVQLIRRLKTSENVPLAGPSTLPVRTTPIRTTLPIDQSMWSALDLYEPGDEWVSGTTIRNYMLNDPLIDWLDRYYTTLGFNDGTMITSEKKMEMEKKVNDERGKMSILFNNGLIFENAVVEQLKQKYPQTTVQIGNSRTDMNYEKYQSTVECMKKGVPIIIQAVLIDKNNKTRGMADLLVRSDYINEIFGENQLTEAETTIPAPKLGTKFHYRVIDIKWTTMHLCADGKLIRNDERIPAYKGQLAIYNFIVGAIQGYFPNKAYILGHSWKYESCGNKFNGSSCFDLLGHIDYKDFDRPYIERTAEAVKWIRNLRSNGSTWTLIPPSVSQLYPNMSNSNDAPWSRVKTIISNKIHELTQLWHVGPKNRKIGHSNDIFKWSDKRCRADKLGINGKKIGPILNEIIGINQNENDVIKPDIIKNNEMNWQIPTDLDFFVDFETVNECFMKKPTNVYNNKSDNNIIFLIGIGYSENGIWKFRSFKMDKLTIDDEGKVIDAWISFINERVEKYKKQTGIKGVMPRLFHWSNAEITSLSIANRRHSYKWMASLKNFLWVDLCKVFQSEPIVVKGAFTFKLKDIAKSMYNHNLITTIWNSDEISDGLSAMLNAIEYYKNQSNDIMERIEKYNEIDCKVMWECINYLRANHCG
jgi:hypothetical protein